MTSNFAKSNLFDLTLSQALSNNKNDLTMKFLNSLEKAQFKLALGEQAVSADPSDVRLKLHPGATSALKHLNSDDKRRSSIGDTTRNAQSKDNRSKSRDLEIVDVDDYWAKWLEFKKKNQKIQLRQSK